ncbi:MAG: nicotinate-nucleotide diphosphorylase (carboxylating) [Lentisphaerae bacterium RIFOXYA12_FULL_48_11]|nr:MAG: nicotinate-nucleotide diphosphorylase (carboxylating) [Lentisphaerae bacterium RIFOXYA12_FULL_48_11]
MKLPEISAKKEVRTLIKNALREDIGQGDITSKALVASKAKARAVIIARNSCIVAGGTIARDVFRQVDAGLKCRIFITDGSVVQRNKQVMEITGSVASILTAERTALNFLQRMSGIASLTADFVKKTRKYNVIILDTRKTTPTLRSLEKYAVLCGGGSNHRMGLYDRILIKDNHLRFWTTQGFLPLDKAVEEARKQFPNTVIEIEVENLMQLQCVLSVKPDWILLDNMTTRQLRECVKACAGKCLLEASGGIKLSNVESVAATGVDAISLGCLTHSAAAADFSLELD